MPLFVGWFLDVIDDLLIQCLNGEILTDGHLCPVLKARRNKMATRFLKNMATETLGRIGQYVRRPNSGETGSPADFQH